MVVIDVRLHLVCEELLGFRLHRPCQRQSPAGPVRRLDGAVRPLVRVEPAQEQQPIVLLIQERPLVEIDRVRHHVAALNALRCLRTLRLADRNKRGLVPLPAIELNPFIFERAVQGVHERLSEPIRHGQRHRRAVIVHNVEAGGAHAFAVDPAEHRTHVGRLDQRVLDLIGVRLVQHLHHARIRLRVRRRVQGDVVPPGHQALTQQPHYLLDSAVGGRRNRDPRWRHHRDP